MNYIRLDNPDISEFDIVNAVWIVINTVIQGLSNAVLSIQFMSSFTVAYLKRANDFLYQMDKFKYHLEVIELCKTIEKLMAEKHDLILIFAPGNDKTVDSYNFKFISPNELSDIVSIPTSNAISIKIDNDFALKKRIIKYLHRANKHFQHALTYIYKYSNILSEDEYAYGQEIYNQFITQLSSQVDEIIAKIEHRKGVLGIVDTQLVFAKYSLYDEDKFVLAEAVSE